MIPAGEIGTGWLAQFRQRLCGGVHGSLAGTRRDDHDKRDRDQLSSWPGQRLPVLVSLIGLDVVAPAFIANAAQLDHLWSHPVYGHAGVVLGLATAWCLAIGVFSQILWDDQPITAPLAHLSWRS